MRSVFCGVLGLLIGACNTNPQPTTPESSKVSPRELQAKTVALVMQRADGSLRPYCSGVWVSERTFVTADHCVAEEDEILSGEVKLGSPVLYAGADDALEGGRERVGPVARGGSVSARKPEWDLALVRARGQTYSHGIARVDLQRVAVGERVATMGHPLGLWWSYSAGEIAAIRYLESPAIYFVQTTAPTSRGNSGCGLYDSEGFLIGIAHAGYTGGANLAFYVHGQYVDALLKAESASL